MASLHTLLSPGVLLSSFSTKGTISSQRGSGDCHLSAGMQDEKRDQNSSVKWGTEVTWASKPAPGLRNSPPKGVEGPPHAALPWAQLGVRGQSALRVLPGPHTRAGGAACRSCSHPTEQVSWFLAMPRTQQDKENKSSFSSGKRGSLLFLPTTTTSSPPKTTILPKYRQLRFEGLLAGMTGVDGRCGPSLTALLCQDTSFRHRICPSSNTQPQPTATRGLINKPRRLVIASNKQLSVFR